MKRNLIFIKRTIESAYVQLVIGSLAFIIGAIDVWDGIEEGFFRADARAGHGVALIGLWHCLRSIIEIIGAFELAEYAEDSLEKGSSSADKLQ